MFRASPYSVEKARLQDETVWKANIAVSGVADYVCMHSRRAGALPGPAPPAPTSRKQGLPFHLTGTVPSTAIWIE